MINVDSLSFEYENGKHVFDGISFHINKGETVGLIGANGTGKTTLMKLILGIVSADSGQITIDDEVVCKGSLSSIRKMVGLVLQNSENQMFMPKVYDDMMFGPLNYGENRDEVEKRVDDILFNLSISHLKNAYNHQLSGGEKKMTAIATVLAMNPEIILLDEPTSALDPTNRRRIINTINGLHNTKIIASHDLDLIYDVCDRVIIISDGKIVADGEKDAILRDKELLENNGLELPLRFQ